MLVKPLLFDTLFRLTADFPPSLRVNDIGLVLILSEKAWLGAVKPEEHVLPKR